MEEPGPCMAQIVNGQDLALSLLWSCSPKSKAKTRPGHAAKARQLAMLLQRRKHVKQGVPRQCWCESLPAQCAIRPTVKRVCVSGNAPCGWAKDLGAGVSHRCLTLLPATPSSHADQAEIPEMKAALRV